MSASLNYRRLFAPEAKTAFMPSYFSLRSQSACLMLIVAPAV